jgi:SAM-dependent methyltransferase
MGARMRSTDLPLPPLDMASRVGSLEGVPAPYEYYAELGRRAREDILDVLPDGWSFEGKRVLDFGCGAGRTLRHFAEEAEQGELWGCDIHPESVEWMQANLSPPFHVFRNGETPPLDRPDGYFDLIWCVSVFTHLTDTWSAWLLELRRVLAPDGLLIVTFMGRGMSELIVGRRWDEERTGMHVLKIGQPWDLGGPMVLHSPWWIREHWGRAFEVLDVRPDGFAADPPIGQGTALLRNTGVPVTAEELERVNPDEPREALALQHNLQTMAEEVLELRRTVDWQTSKLAEHDQARERLERAHDNVVGSSSWRVTRPLREARERLGRLRRRGA